MDSHFKSVFMKTLIEFIDALETIDLSLCPKIEKSLKVYRASMERINQDKLINQFMKLTDPFESHIADSNPSMFDDPEKTSFFKHIEFGDLYRSIPECRSSLFKYLQIFRASGSLVSGGSIDNIIKNIQERNEKEDDNIPSSLPKIDFSKIEPENLKKATGMLKNLCGENESLNAVFDSIGDEMSSFTEDQDEDVSNSLDDMSESDKAQLNQVSQLMKTSMNMDDKTVNKMMKMASNVAKQIGNADTEVAGNPNILNSIQQGLGNLSIPGMKGLSGLLNKNGDLGTSDNPVGDLQMGGLQNMMSSMVSNLTDREDAGAGIANLAKMLAKNSQS